jgi:hypothetical protein
MSRSRRRAQGADQKAAVTNAKRRIWIRDLGARLGYKTWVQDLGARFGPETRKPYRNFGVLCSRNGVCLARKRNHAILHERREDVSKLETCRKNGHRQHGLQQWPVLNRRNCSQHCGAQNIIGSGTMNLKRIASVDPFSMLQIASIII